MKKLFSFLLLVIVMCAIASCDVLEGFLGSPDDENTEQPENPDNTDVELPLYCDDDSIEGWTNTRFCKNGMTVFTKNFEETSAVQKTLMFVPVDSLGVVSVYGEFDENGYPTYLAFDDVVAFIDSYTDTTFNATLIKGEQVLWTATDLPFEGIVETKSWSENNWVRNAAAIGGVITSGVGIGIGVALTGTGVGTAAGVVSVGLASKALVDNLNVLFGPGESYAENSYIKNQLQGIGQNTLVDALAKDSDSYLNNIFKNSDYFNQKYNLPNLFWAELALGLVDELWGKTVTESQRQMAYALAQRSYQVVTKHASDVTKHTAVLWGYVTPEAITPLNQFADVEYGIVVYKKDDPSDRRNIEDIVCNGGEFSLFFNGLDAKTEYCYFVYYYDMTNSCFRQGATKSFVTRGSDYLTLDSISCDDDYYYYTDNGVGNVSYNLTAEISGDTAEIEEFQSCGIYIFDNKTGKSYIWTDDLEGSYNRTDIELSIGIPANNYENIDHSRYYAETSRYSAGVYVKFNDDTYYMSESKTFTCVYDRKPKYRFTSAGPISVWEVGSEVTEAGETIIHYNAEHSLSYVLDGVFWIESIQAWCDGTWVFSDTNEKYGEPWNPNMDLEVLDAINGPFSYWSTSAMYHSVWRVITTKNGETLYSNSLVYGGTPTSPTVSIGGTRSFASSISNGAGSQPVVGRPNGSIDMMTLEDTHASENNVVEIDKLPILNN